MSSSPGVLSETLVPWLDERLSMVPAELERAVRALVGSAGCVDSESMAAAALEGFDRVVAEPARREGALQLLAADALLTYAFEAAADPACGGTPSRAMDLAARIGLGGRLGRRMGEGA